MASTSRSWIAARESMPWLMTKKDAAPLRAPRRSKSLTMAASVVVRSMVGPCMTAGFGAAVSEREVAVRPTSIGGDGSQSPVAGGVVAPGGVPARWEAQ